jgi:hypothetical protein
MTFVEYFALVGWILMAILFIKIACLRAKIAYLNNEINGLKDLDDRNLERLKTKDNIIREVSEHLKSTNGLIETQEEMISMQKEALKEMKEIIELLKTKKET